MKVDSNNNKTSLQAITCGNMILTLYHLINMLKSQWYLVTITGRESLGSKMLLNRACIVTSLFTAICCLANNVRAKTYSLLQLLVS